VRGGSTLLLTTQYLEEADRLADNILVIDHGRAIAQGTAAQLKDQAGGARIELTLAETADLEPAREILERFADGPVEMEQHSRRLVGPVTGGSATLVDAVHRLDSAGIVVLDVALRRPTLDEVFLKLTGHRSDAEADPSDAPAERPSEASRR
jgi:ABC-2 type transport system ATP-binding protein